jgi:hypothetical protein
MFIVETLHATSLLKSAPGISTSSSLSVIPCTPYIARLVCEYFSCLSRISVKTSWRFRRLYEFAEAYAQAVWLEQFRLRNMAELLSAMFGAKKK